MVRMRSPVQSRQLASCELPPSLRIGWFFNVEKILQRPFYALSYDAKLAIRDGSYGPNDLVKTLWLGPCF